jgi:hypothetical protein
MSSDSHSQPAVDKTFDGTFAGTVRRQILLGLDLDATARLRWLERTREELFRLRGLAKSSPR